LRDCNLQRDPRENAKDSPAKGDYRRIGSLETNSGSQREIGEEYEI